MNRNLLIALVCMIMMFTLFFSFIFFPRSTILVNADTDDVKVTAGGMVVIEQTSKRVLFEKDKDKPIPMASTTKIMTALIALEKCEDIDIAFKVDNRAVGIEGTSIYLKNDEWLTMRELLYGLILSSGNDASMAIAYKIGNGDAQKFVDLMNAKVEELNLHNTHFDNPHGLDSNTHFTSAYDLAVISAKAMENETFREISKTLKKQISSNKQNENRFLRNKHKLLTLFEGCDGIKTGFTDQARRCCVTSAKRDNMRLICIVLNCNDMFEESAELLNRAFDKYKMVEILEPYKFLTSIKVEDGEMESVKLYTEKGFSYPLTEKENEFVTIKQNMPSILNCPLEKHQEVGNYQVYLFNDLLFTEKIYTMEAVRKAGVANKMKDIVEHWYYN